MKRRPWYLVQGMVIGGSMGLVYWHANLYAQPIGLITLGAVIGLVFGLVFDLADSLCR